MPAPYRRTLQATSDGFGTISFEFGPVNDGEVWTGPVIIPGAPMAAQFLANVADVPWGQWSGPQPSQQVQADGRLTLTISGVGLLPDTVYNATWLTITDDAADAPIVYPSQAYSVPPFVTEELIGVAGATLIAGNVKQYPDSGAFDTRGWAAVRLAAINQSGVGGPVLWVFVNWRDASDTVNMAQRLFVLSSGDTCSLTFPVLGDIMAVSVLNVDGTVAATATYSLQVELTSAPAQAWSFTSIGQTVDSVLAAGTTNCPNGAETLVFSTTATYAGLADLQLSTAAIANYSARAAYIDPLGAETTWRRWDAATDGARVTQMLLLPPAPLRFYVTNNSGAAHNVSFGLVADNFRSA